MLPCHRQTQSLSRPCLCRLTFAQMSADRFKETTHGAVQKQKGGEACSAEASSACRKSLESILHAFEVGRHKNQSHTHGFSHSHGS